MTPLLTLFAAAIGSILGSIFGAVVALSQFQEERAYERRVDWYEKTASSLARLSWIYAKAHHAARRGEAKETARLVNDDLPLVVEVFQQQNGMRDLYADEGALKALAKVTEEINEIGDLVQAVKSVGGHDPEGHLLLEMVKVLDGAREAVVLEARAILYPKGSQMLRIARRVRG
jgi:hypothetical protein